MSVKCPFEPPFIAYAGPSLPALLRGLLLFIILPFLLLGFQPCPSWSAEVQAVNARLQNNEISITASVSLDQKSLQEIQEGMSKELILYIDLFRVWEVWPDEFVTGKKITRQLKSNPIKREYTAVSMDGSVYLEKRFKDFGSMISWATSVNDLKLTNIRELEHGIYFVKFTVESSLRKLPPVIGYFLFFVPEKEFKVSRNSEQFSLPQREAP